MSKTSIWEQTKRIVVVWSYQDEQQMRAFVKAIDYFLQQKKFAHALIIVNVPKDIDKKMIIWEKVAKKEPQITWQFTKNNTLKKENFDQTDAYTCVLGYMRFKEIWK